MQRRPRTRAPVFTVLQDRDFRAIWYLGGLHEISRRMELLVLSWLILQTTDSPFQLGLVLVFNNLPRPFSPSLRALSPTGSVAAASCSWPRPSIPWWPLASCC